VQLPELFELGAAFSELLDEVAEVGVEVIEP